MATSRQLREQIAAGRWDAALAALYGGSEEVLARQRSRYGAALEQFELYYGPGRQVQVYSAPGRTELGGNHTDHQHGYGLAGAVTLDLVAVLRKFILLLPLIYLMPHLVPDPTLGVYLAEPVADTLAVTFTSILFSHQFRKALRTLESERSA